MLIKKPLKKNALKPFIKLDVVAKYEKKYGV